MEFGIEIMELPLRSPQKLKSLAFVRTLAYGDYYGDPIKGSCDQALFKHDILKDAAVVIQEGNAKEKTKNKDAAVINAVGAPTSYQQQLESRIRIFKEGNEQYTDIIKATETGQYKDWWNPSNNWFRENGVGKVIRPLFIKSALLVRDSV